MTAAVEFFCTPDEERTFLTLILAKPGAQCAFIGDRTQTIVNNADLTLPGWSKHLELLIWNTTIGELVWHETRPRSEDNNADGFRASVLAQLTWDEARPRPSDRLLDSERSPALVYTRGRRAGGRITPSRLKAPPSSAARVSLAYKRWVTSTLGWIRRRGVIVHDWHSPSRALPNRLQLVTTVYALPQAKAILDNGNHKYAIS